MSRVYHWASENQFSAALSWADGQSSGRRRGVVDRSSRDPLEADRAHVPQRSVFCFSVAVQRTQASAEAEQAPTGSPVLLRLLLLQGVLPGLSRRRCHCFWQLSSPVPTGSQPRKEIRALPAHKSSFTLCGGLLCRPPPNAAGWGSHVTSLWPGHSGSSWRSSYDLRHL